MYTGTYIQLAVIRVYLYIYGYVCTHIYIYVYIYMYIHFYTKIHISISTYICIYIYIYLFIHIHMYTHTCITYIHRYPASNWTLLLKRPYIFRFRNHVSICLSSGADFPWPRGQMKQVMEVLSAHESLLLYFLTNRNKRLH